jgi:hypothetical protein
LLSVSRALCIAAIVAGYAAHAPRFAGRHARNANDLSNWRLCTTGRRDGTQRSFRDMTVSTKHSNPSIEPHHHETISALDQEFSTFA